MPGKVPLTNAKFTNAPDFDNQTVSGITGSGVFRQFSANNPNTNTWTVGSSDAWSMVLLTGNSLVTIPANIATIDIGDEILFVNATGTISFTTSGGAELLSAAFYSVPATRPARLIYAGSNHWILAGAKTAYSASTVYDCCGVQQYEIYTFGAFSTDTLAYTDSYGSAVYTFSGPGGVCEVGDTGYTIASGIITESPCASVNFDHAYTFYPPPFYAATTLYTYESIDIFNDAELMSVAFKTETLNSVYPCDATFAVNGSYYRYFGMYGASNPVCFSDGIVTATGVC